MAASWLKLSVKAAPASLDTVANYLIERGSPGVVLKEEEVQAFFPCVGKASSLKRDIRRFLDSIRDIFPEGVKRPLRWTTLKDRNWNSSWQRFFSPQKVARGFLIVPPWRIPKRSGRRQVITIEPGMAFGTGTHPTTRGCLEFLEEVVTRAKGGDSSALDLGTGSGILAIALAKMGVRRVVAIDNDPVAARVARLNVRRNRATVRVLHSEIDALRGSFSVVVANLTAEAIAALAPQIEKKVSAGGYLVLSGLLDEGKSGVLGRFAPRPFALVRQKSSRGWATLLLNKRL